MAPRLDSLVRAQFELSWSKARSYIETGKIFVGGVAITDSGAEIGAGASIELKMNTPRARTQAAAAKGLFHPEILHQDSQIVVVAKPAGMNTVPYPGENEETLEGWLAEKLRQPKVFVVQRLDRETSGVLVFARNAEAAKMLGNQFRFHTVQRRYLALAHGKVESQTLRSFLIENRGDGLRGSRPPGSAIHKEDSKEAITHVKALREIQTDGGPASLIECRLETGRTHQIRIHLSEAGHPLLGEKAYIREFTGPRIPAPRIMLHATELGFIHPTRESPVSWTLPVPADFREFVPDL